MKFADFEVLLGLPPSESEEVSTAQVNAVAAVWAKKVEEWEAISPLKLVQHKPTIFKIAGAIDSEQMFSPVVIDVLNGNAPSKAPIYWEERVIVSLPAGVLTRFNSIAGMTARACMAQSIMVSANEMAGKTRWARLDPVKELAFKRHREAREINPQLSRAASIRKMLPEVLEASRLAGEPLSGDETAVMETVTRWFRKAEIK
jgi:hypothetical protein